MRWAFNYLTASGRAVRLTDAGEIYLHHARRALHELTPASAVKELNDLSYVICASA